MPRGRIKVKHRRGLSRNARWYGANWIRQEKRLAIYLRDGMRCIWCTYAASDGARLTLDHVNCVENGGDNEAQNIITACHQCNYGRGDREATEFAGAVAEYLGKPETFVADIVARIEDKRMKLLNIAHAKHLIKLFGSATKVISGLSALSRL